jgi:hypothetical protein
VKAQANFPLTISYDLQNTQLHEQWFSTMPRILAIMDISSDEKSDITDCVHAHKVCLCV